MILGIYLTDEQVVVKASNKDVVDTFPLILCKLHDNSFDIGQRAYEQSLNNNGILIDKLVYKSIKAKDVLVDNNTYQTYNLFQIYFKNLFLEYGNIDFVCVTLNTNNPILFKDIEKALFYVLDDKNKFILTTNSDVFIKYAMQLDINKDNNGNFINKQPIGLIDFVDKSLVYYELSFKNFEGYDKEFIEVNPISHSPIPLDLLKENNGIRIIDGLLLEFAKKVTENKNYAFFLLSGYGFKDQAVYRDFINYICSFDCQILKEENLFTLGAETIGLDTFNGIIDNKYYYITDNRTRFSITLSDSVSKFEKKICDFGIPWFSNKITFQIIVYNTNELIFNIDKYNAQKTEQSILLNKDFVIRDNKTTKLEVEIEFLQHNVFNITVKDIGFGDFYDPIESARTTKDFNI